MHKQRKKLRIGITIGDLNGIGPELIIQGLQDPRLKEQFTPVIYGSTRVLNEYRKVLKAEKFSYNVVQTPSQAQPRKISVIDCVNNGDNVEMGKATPVGGKGAFEALEAAVRDLRAQEIDALVTMPIDKSAIQSQEFTFPGHTEYLATTFGVEDSLMFMISDLLRVGVVTGHVPVKDISKHLTVPLIYNKIKLMNQSLKVDFNLPKPKIAVLGLNPHAGDNGLLGKEEKEKIERAIEKATGDKMLVVGPFGADGFFGSGAYRNFDGILAMYHDQGLIPFKLLAGFSGVNFTAGLPVVRTSPDHGVAYDLAGKGEASVESFLQALYQAMDLCRARGENISGIENSIYKKKIDTNNLELTEEDEVDTPDENDE